MKKLVAAVLVLLMSVNMTVVGICEEEVRTARITAEEMGYGLPQEGYYLPDRSRISLMSDDDFAEFDSVLYEAMKNREESANIEKFGYSCATDEDLTVFFDDVIKVITDHPELYYVRTGCAYTYSTGTKAIKTVKFHYNEAFDKSNDEIFDAAVNNILDEAVREGMTDEEIALALNDYLANHITYCTDYNLEGTPETIYSAYGAIVEKSAVCQGYSLAFNMLLDKCGIDSEFVNSDAMLHAWSMVCLDDEWYHTDVTWADGYERNYGTDKLLVSHEYFLKSDAYFLNNEHHSWNESVPDCTSTKYESDYPFNKPGAIGRSTYTYRNGYFYVGNTYDGTYAKTRFDGSELEYISLADYNAGLSEEETEPTPTPTPTPTPDPEPEMTYVQAIGRYAEEVEMQYSITEESISMELVLLDTSDFDVDCITIYIAGYSDGKLEYIKAVDTEVTDGSAKGVGVTRNEELEYKIMVWDENSVPVVPAITE